MNLNEKIKDFIQYKTKLEAEIDQKAKDLNEEFLAYIRNKDIALEDRFNLWMDTPNDMKEYLDYDEVNHKYKKTFIKFMYSLASSGIEFQVDVDVTHHLWLAMDNDKFEGRVFNLNKEETRELMEFILETNIGDTVQMETD